MLPGVEYEEKNEPLQQIEGTHQLTLSESENLLKQKKKTISARSESKSELPEQEKLTGRENQKGCRTR